MPQSGFERAIPANERPQTHALDRAATETGVTWRYRQQFYCTCKGKLKVKVAIKQATKFQRVSTFIALHYLTLALHWGGRSTPRHLPLYSQEIYPVRNVHHSNCCYLCTRLHGITCQNIVTCLVTVSNKESPCVQRRSSQLGLHQNCI